MKFLRLIWLVLSFVIGASQTASADQDGYLDPEKAFVMRAELSGSDTILLNFEIAPGYYMYRDRFQFAVSGDEIKLGDPVFPPGKVKFDKTFNQEMELYFSALKIRVPFSVTPQDTSRERTTPSKVTVIGQGCAEAGLCYPPMDFIVTLIPSANGLTFTIDQPQKSLLNRLAEGNLSDILFGGHDEGLASLLSSSGLIELTLLFFVLGLLLALTPCVLPMVPILSVLLVGEQHHVSRGRGFLLAAAYVAGMSVVYTALGIGAGLSGAGLAAWLQTPWVLAGFSVLLGLLALAMFDVYQFQMPSNIQSRLTVANSHILGGRMRAAWLMGALSALIVGPCVAAPLAGALLYISQTGDVVLGGTVLFAMAWGMGVPLLLMGASAGKLMPRAGAWMEGVKKFFGVLLFATAWWMVMPLLPSWLQILGWAVLAMLAAMLLRPFDPLPQDAGFAGVLRKTLGMLLVLVSAVWVVAVASGGRSLLQPLSHLAQLKQTGAMAAQPTDPATSKSAGSSAKQQLFGSSPNANTLRLTDQNQTSGIDKDSKTTDTGHPVFIRVKNLAELDAMIAQSKKPVMLDFYADWCVSCKEMEAFTFVDPVVAKKMNQMLLLQADVTGNSNDDRALLKKFRLFGPPGIIFFQPGGQERRDIRVVGFQDAARFASTLDRILK